MAVAGCSSDGPPAPDASSSATVALNTPPTALRWDDFNGMSIPEAAQGPHVDDAEAPHGFDRTPPGASLAAINATIRLSVALDDQWADITRTLIAPGTARDDFIRNRIQLSTTAPVPAGQAPTIQGWKVTAFSPDRAAVDIVTALPDRSLTLNHTTVVWTAADDWGLLLPDPTATTRPVDTITALPGGDFVPVKES